MRFNKYESGNSGHEPEFIDDLLEKEEKILWRGKPKKNAFIINKARTMFPFAIIWLLVDSIVIYAFINDPEAMKFRL